MYRRKETVVFVCLFHYEKVHWAPARRRQRHRRIEGNHPHVTAPTSVRGQKGEVEKKRKLRADPLY